MFECKSLFIQQITANTPHYQYKQTGTTKCLQININKTYFIVLKSAWKCDNGRITNGCFVVKADTQYQRFQSPLWVESGH